MPRQAAPLRVDGARPLLRGDPLRPGAATRLRRVRRSVGGEIDVTRGTITLIGSLSFLVYGGAQPFVGRAVDAFGIRRTLATSTLLVAAGLALSAASQSPLQLALAYGVVASLGFGGASGVAASVAVTYWFTQRSGLAFGLVEAGFGAGQLLLVPIALAVIPLVGWRTAMAGAAVFLTVVVAPVLWRSCATARRTSAGCRSAARSRRPGRRRARRGRRGHRRAPGAAALPRVLGPGHPVLRLRDHDHRADRHAPHPARPGARHQRRHDRARGRAPGGGERHRHPGLRAAGRPRRQPAAPLRPVRHARALPAGAARLRRRAGADPLRDPVRDRRLLHRGAHPVARRALRLAAHGRPRLRLPQRDPPARVGDRRPGCRGSPTTPPAPTTARSSSPPRCSASPPSRASRCRGRGPSTASRRPRRHERRRRVGRRHPG